MIYSHTCNVDMYFEVYSVTAFSKSFNKPNVCILKILIYINIFNATLYKYIQMIIFLLEICGVFSLWSSHYSFVWCHLHRIRHLECGTCFTQIILTVKSETYLSFSLHKSLQQQIDGGTFFASVVSNFQFSLKQSCPKPADSYTNI